MLASHIRKSNGQKVFSEKGSPIIGCSKSLMKDPLDFIERVHAHGEGLVNVNIPLMNIAMVCDAGLINEILTDKSDSFRKSDRDLSVLSGLLGSGLITSNGEAHKAQKKRVVPAFKTKWFQHYLEKTNSEVAKYVTSIKPGEYVDIVQDIVDITFIINMRILFGDEIVEIEGGLPQLSSIIDELGKVLLRRMTGAVIFPKWVPSNENRYVTKLQNTLHESIDKLIGDRLKMRNSADDQEDMLSILINELDTGSGDKKVKLIRDELLTLFVAGYETTASTLTWVFYHLGNNSEWLDKIYSEVDQIESTEEMTYEDCRSLVNTDMVIKETLRIHSVIWAIVDRQANEDVQLGDYYIPKDKVLFLSPWGLHRNPKYFENPELFEPSRFTSENIKKIVKGSYFPFGMGNRICLGAGLSMIVMKSIISGILRKYEFSLDPEQEIIKEATISLKSKNGLRVKFKERR